MYKPKSVTRRRAATWKSAHLQIELFLLFTYIKLICVWNLIFMIILKGKF